MKQSGNTGIGIEELSDTLRNIFKEEFAGLLASGAHNQPEYLTRNEVSKLLRVDLSTLHHWKRKGILTPYGIGGRVLYKKEEVEQALVELK